jgi:hypothetical protein
MFEIAARAAIAAGETTTTQEATTTTTTAGGVDASVGSWGVLIGLVALLLLVVFLLGAAWWRSKDWGKDEECGRLRGLALPSGSVRAVIALVIIGGFVLFAFYGRAVVGDNDQFTAILASWITLTGAVSGFYFGARTGQTLDKEDKQSKEDEETSVEDEETSTPAPSVGEDSATPLEGDGESSEPG